MTATTDRPVADGAPDASRPPRKLRSLLIGVVIAAVLAVLLFVVVGTGHHSGSGTGSASGVTVGGIAPDFSLPNLSGGAPVDLDALGVDRHRPVILNFFASDCPPCQQETPLLGHTASAQKAAGSPVQFVGVDVNDATSAALNFVHRSGVTYPIGADHTFRVASGLYALAGEPDTFFIDASGHVIGHKLGALNQAELTQWLHRLAPSAS